MNQTLTPSTTPSRRKILQLTRRKYTVSPDKPYPSMRSGDRIGAQHCRTGRLMTVLRCTTVLCLFHSLAYAEYGVQVGAFANQDNATRLAENINEQGFTAIIVPGVDHPEKLTRVIVGPYADTASAVAAHHRLTEHNWAGLVVEHTAGTTRTEQNPSDDSADYEEVLIAEAPTLDSAADLEELIIEDLTDDTPAGNQDPAIDEPSEIMFSEEQPGESLPDSETLVIEDGDQEDADTLYLVNRPGYSGDCLV